MHWGATSQDVIDTAARLVALRTRALIDGTWTAPSSACARLAGEHRWTPMAGRTLLQQALPTTFGLKAAGWLDGALDARERLAAVELRAQLGGAAGTLASIGGDACVGERRRRAPRAGQAGAAVARPAGAGRRARRGAGAGGGRPRRSRWTWRCSRRSRSARWRSRRAAAAAARRRCRTSATPWARSARVRARQVRGAVSVLMEAMAGEHERAAGAWHSEWVSLTTALAFTGGAASAMAEVLEGLEVRPERMAANATGGLLGGARHGHRQRADRPRTGAE